MARIVVFASHSEPLIRQFCAKGILLEGGRLVDYGGLDEVFQQYRKLA